MTATVATVLMILAVAGCAGHHETVSGRGVGHHGPGGPSPTGLSHASQMDSAQEALLLRREADQLRAMAERREQEAIILSRDPSADRQMIREKQQLARRLLEAANAAEREAEALTRQVPHNMVQ